VKKPTYEELGQKIKNLEQECFDLKRKEKKLRASHEKYKALIDLKLNCIYIHDFEGKFLDANNASLNLLGYAKEEIPSLNFASLIEEDQFQQAFETLEEIKQTGSQRNFSEYKLKKKNDEHVWVETDGSLIYHDKYPYAVLAVARDITDRRKAEEALRESEESYRILVEDMPALICRFTPDGTLSFVNKSYCQYFDKTRDELLNENFFQFIPEEEREKVKTHFESLTQEKPAISYEHQVLMPDGKLGWQRWTDRALFDEDTKLYQYQSVGMDITESKTAEYDLRESEKRFRELAELMPETIYEMDLKGTLTFVNRKAFEHFGYTQEDIDGGLNAFDIVAPEDRERAIENIRRIMKGESIGLNEYMAIRKDGSTFPIMIHSTPIILQEELIGVRGFIIDLTDRKKAEEERIKLEAQFQQAQRLETIGTLAGGIAHDFNNLLMTIQGNTSLILFDVDASQPHYEPLKNIEKQIERGAKLTKQLLG
jgi:PAS domain S-box-containing protein